jgi:exodeoxyribonuclease VII small subunit
MLRLDEILENMQSGDIGLADSVRLFEEGMTLIETLSGELDGVRQKVQVLLERSADPVLGEFGDGRIG